MRHERIPVDDPRIEPAIEQIKALILARYPAACFEVSRGGDPEGIYLTATVDVEDTDEVMDLYIDHLIDLQVEERLPLYVLSLQPFERIVATVEAELARSPRLVTQAALRSVSGAG
jgi:hypothetical protein